MAYQSRSTKVASAKGHTRYKEFLANVLSLVRSFRSLDTKRYLSHNGLNILPSGIFQGLTDLRQL